MGTNQRGRGWVQQAILRALAKKDKLYLSDFRKVTGEQGKKLFTTYYSVDDMTVGNALVRLLRNGYISRRRISKKCSCSKTISTEVPLPTLSKQEFKEQRDLLARKRKMIARLRKEASNHRFCDYTPDEVEICNQLDATRERRTNKTTTFKCVLNLKVFEYQITKKGRKIIV